MTCNYYKSFGLIWKFEGLKISELIELNSPTKYDVLIKEDIEIKWEDREANKFDTFFIRIKRNNIKIKLEDLGILEIFNGKNIHFKKISPAVDDRDIINFIVGSGFGAILIQRDYLVLHGNALEKNNEAIICLGSSGEGKSTLAYTLMRKGWSLISDDQVAINSDGYVLPGIPRIKLWEEVFNAFNLDFKNCKRIRKDINKYILDKSNIRKYTENCKLKSIYILNINRSEMHNNFYGLKKIKSEKEAILKLKDNLFRPRFVKGLKKGSFIFVNLVNLIKNIKIIDLILPNGIINMDKALNDLVL